MWIQASGLFADAGNLEVGDLGYPAHLHLSVEAEVFIRIQRGTKPRDQGREFQVLYMKTSTVTSNKPSDGPASLILV